MEVMVVIETTVVGTVAVMVVVMVTTVVATVAVMTILVMVVVKDGGTQVDVNDGGCDGDGEGDGKGHDNDQGPVVQNAISLVQN